MPRQVERQFFRYIDIFGPAILHWLDFWTHHFLIAVKHEFGFFNFHLLYRTSCKTMHETSSNPSPPPPIDTPTVSSAPSSHRYSVLGAVCIVYPSLSLLIR